MKSISRWSVDIGIKREAAVMTLRMGLISIVGLVSSRVVLKTLGVDDYGTYCAVAGLVWAFAFLNSSVTDSGTRFITFALGTGKSRHLQTVFSTSFGLHLATSLAVAIVAEIAGLWYLDHKMILPPENRQDAFWVFQLVLASLIVGFMQQPYCSLILAHEKFGLYSRIELLQSALNLLLVAFLLNHDDDKLIMYASLLLALQIFVALTYMAYATSRYSESRLKKGIDFGVMKQMLGFSGCGVFGNMCVTVYNQGNPLVVNMFFGVAANASVSLAGTLAGVISSIATTGIICVYSPLITKDYAALNLHNVERNLCNSVKYTLRSFGLLALPTMAMMPELLSLWLGSVPEDMVEISFFSLFTAMIAAIIVITNTAIHATGDIRRLSFVNGSMYVLIPALGWMAYRLGGGILWLFAIENAVMVAILVNGCRIISRQIPGIDVVRYTQTIFRNFAAVAVALIAVWVIMPVFR